jgi:hypothetical protein
MESARVPRRKTDPIKIAILGGDVLVSRSLEIALQGAGYDACYLNGSLTDHPAELPEGVRLVIFAPRMSAERRKAFLSRIRSLATGVPALELATVLAEARAEQEGVGLVAWPCSTEELTRRIEAALLNGVGPEPDGSLRVRGRG